MLKRTIWRRIHRRIHRNFAACRDIFTEISHLVRTDDVLAKLSDQLCTVLGSAPTSCPN